jgi:arylsulfatase A-like enzyme
MTPNIIFILVDDLGWMDLSCQGSSFYETPNIDRLAIEGMRFTDAYAACPVCSPTRASILSGKYPARLGLTHFIAANEAHQQGRFPVGKLLGVPYVPYFSTQETSLATTLHNHGYATWHVGKWHLGTREYYPDRHGFDVNIGGCHVGSPLPPNGYFAPWGIENLEPRSGDHYLDDRLGDDAVKLIRERNPDKPFLLNFWPYLVHTPTQAKPETIAKYVAKANVLGLDKVNPIMTGEQIPFEHPGDVRVQRRIIQSDPVYAAMIEHLDDNVGKLLDALDELGIADNTIVVFTSDNGGLATSEGSPTCNAPLREGKGWMEEGGVREPLLIRWPARIKPGTETDAVITSPDFYPTLLEACGLPLRPEQHQDGTSFLPALDGKPHDRGSIFWHFPHYGNQGGIPGCSIRRSNWKLIELFEGGIALYNLKEDPSEKHDLSDQHPELSQELLSALHAWQEEMHAIVPQPNPDWKPWRDRDLNPLD